MLYRRSWRDWLGPELVRCPRDGLEPCNALRRRTRSSLRRAKLVALLALSVRFDPFITALYLRARPAGSAGLILLIELARGLWRYIGG
ncbi:MAG: hypothetical protein EXR01_04450 [Acetobacteraceae bacterium]|nr:hypothetical protein [Acetobacteraceae bacterium]MSP30972.1 hypothetical protein [Acetobacteraceae bacterium]